MIYNGLKKNPTKYIRIPYVLLFCYWGSGFWIRFFCDRGPGIHGKDKTKNIVTYSDRVNKRLVIGKWSFKRLKREKIIRK